MKDVRLILALRTEKPCDKAGYDDYNESDNNAPAM